MPESANEHLDWLEAEIRRTDPKVILDVGMGRGNYGWFLRERCKWRGRLVGIEVWAPYVVGPEALAGGNRSRYNEIIVIDVRDAHELMLQLRPDVVFAFDVIEHLRRDEGVKALRSMQLAAQSKVLVSLPIVEYSQGPLHGNDHETHLYDWSCEEMISLGSELRHKGVVTGLFEFAGGGIDKLVTVMMNTVREDAATAGRPAIRSVVDDIAKQTMRTSGIEFIVVDGLFPWRWSEFAEHSYPFRVLHVPPKQTPMVTDRRCAISAYKNTGLAHARGQLIVTVDDCCVLDAGFLQRCWDAWVQRRELLSALHRAVGAVNITDSRTVNLGADGKCVGPVGGHPGTPSMYGFASLPLEAVVKVNGYDEMFDGSRGLEDMDMGVRLQSAGYRIALDRGHVVVLHPQGPWSPKVFGDHIVPGSGEDHTNVKCCQTTFRIQRERGVVRANETAWGTEHWAKVAPRCHLLTSEMRCSLNGHMCPYVGTCSDREHPSLKLLKDSPPIFDLMKARVANGIR